MASKFNNLGEKINSTDLIFEFETEGKCLKDLEIIKIQ